MSKTCATQTQMLSVWGFRHVSLQASTRVAVHRAILSVGAYGNPGACMPAFFYTWSTGGK